MSEEIKTYDVEMIDVELIKLDATKKFKFTVQGKVYKDIKGLLDILLDAEFK